MAIEPEAREAAEVMARYCRGDAAAFHRLYALLAPRILAYLTGLLGDKAAAEDMLQLTFLKVHEARSTLRARRQPDPVDLHDRAPHLPGRDPQAQAQPRPAEQGRRARRRAGRPHHRRRRGRAPRSRRSARPVGRRRRARGAGEAARKPAPGADPDQGPRALDRRRGDDHRQHAGRDQAARAPRLRDAAADARPQGGRHEQRRQGLRRSRARRGDRRRRAAARAVGRSAARGRRA